MEKKPAIEIDDQQEVVPRTQFRIASYRMQELADRFSKINKRAEKLDVPGISYEVVDTVTEDILDSDTHKPTGKVRTYNIIEVHGSATKIEGWSFVATIEHHVDDSGNGMNLLRKVPSFDSDLPTVYRERGPEHCDHCGMVRRRKDTFVIYHEESNTFKQVGRSCLKDFLGHSSPEALARLCEMEVALDLGSDYWEDGAGCGYSEPYFNHQSVINATVAVINRDGWLSRSQARDMYGAATATADSVWDYLNPPRYLSSDRKYWEKAWGDFEITDNDREKATKVVEWCQDLGNGDVDSLNDYLYNLRAAFRLAAVGGKQIGLVCSAVAAYDRAMEQEIKRRQFAKTSQDSEHFGTIKKRQTITVTVLAVYDTEGFYGTTHIHKMVTDDGNICTWFTGTERLGVGKRYSGKATPKKHDVYRGTKQTVVTRCKLEEVDND